MNVDTHIKRRVLPIKTTERLLLYKTILAELLEQGEEYIHSYRLAEIAKNNAAQVRRDIMAVKYTGVPSRGYHISDLIKKIDRALSLGKRINMALIGAGRLGLAIMSYFQSHKTRFNLTTAFDISKDKANKQINGCHIYSLHDLKEIIEKERITFVILTTPDKSAQYVADLLSETKVKGILNFTSIPLKVKKGIMVNRIDITLEMEKLAFYSH